MVSVRSLSDEELHTQLLTIGITTPVTATTRPLLIKKLHQSKIDKKVKVCDLFKHQIAFRHYC